MVASTSGERSLGEQRVDVLEPQPLEVIAAEVKAKKRNMVLGVRVVGRRIYDPENGKTCHQKTTDFAAASKQVKKKGSCPIGPIKYCRKCLLNRLYIGEFIKKNVKGLQNK